MPPQNPTNLNTSFFCLLTKLSITPPFNESALSRTMLCSFHKRHYSDYAHYMFDEMPLPDYTTHNNDNILLRSYTPPFNESVLSQTMLCSFHKRHYSDYAHNAFDEMPLPDYTTHNNGNILLRSYTPPFKESVLSRTMLCSFHKRHYSDYAHNMFDEMPLPDYTTHNNDNILLRSYTAAHQHTESISLLKQMHENGIQPDFLSLSAVIKSSAMLCHGQFGQLLHGLSLKNGYFTTIAVQKALMDMYGRLDMIDASCKIFDDIELRDSVSWNIILTLLGRARLYEPALDWFRSMHVCTESKFSAVTIAVMAPIFAKLKNLKMGLIVHGYVIKVGLENNTLTGNALLSMYAKCNGSIVNAYKVFEFIEDKDVISWNSIIAGFSENGLVEESLKLFREMVLRGFRPNYATIANVLPICALTKDGRYYGKEIHGYLLRVGLESDISVCNALLTHYSNVADMNTVELVVEQMHSRDIVTWNTIIAGYNAVGNISRSLELFHQLLLTGPKPDSVTLISVLPACAQIGYFEEGRIIHAYILRRPTLFLETPLMNALITFYGQFSKLDKATHTFNSISSKDLISWNSALSVYADRERCNEFWDLLNEMSAQGIRPDHVTLVSALRVSGIHGGKQVKEAHASSLRLGFLNEKTIANSIIEAYGKCGNLNYASKFFRSVVSACMKHDLIIWCTMLQVHAKCEIQCVDQAFDLFHELQRNGFRPNSAIITSILSACTRLASVDLVKQCHGFKIRASLQDIFLEGAILDAYSKSGSIKEASKLFKSIPKKDLVTFTSMVSCFAMHGLAREALKVFDEMLELKIMPDHVILTALLSACSHAGLLDEGWGVFNSMREIYGVDPRMEHYTCMVDLMARAGLLLEACEFVSNMPFEANATVWGSLLGACKIHGNMDMARIVARKLFEIEESNMGNYVVMSNIYAKEERWDGVEHVRNLMKSKEFKKPAGCSWVEVEKIRHLFVVGDSFHPKNAFIYEILGSLDRQIKDDVIQLEFRF